MRQLRAGSGQKCWKRAKKSIWDDLVRSCSPYFTFRNIFSLYVFEISDIHFHWPVWVHLPKRVVGWTIEETRKKWIFCVLLTVLWRCWSRHGLKIWKSIEKVAIFVIFEHFSPILLGGSVGSPSQDINIYTFWIDLDVICSNLPEYRTVPGPSGPKIESYNS